MGEGVIMTRITLDIDKLNLADEDCRQYTDILARKIDTINERTKSHTIEIRNLRKQLKENKK